MSLTTNIKTLLKYSAFFISITLCSQLLMQCQNAQELEKAKREGVLSFDSWRGYQAHLNKFPKWRLQGKIGITFPHKGKRKAASASIDWQQNNNDFDMALSGPLGMGRFTIAKRPNQTVLTNHKGKEYYSTSPERLFYEHTGMAIPWSELSWWVRALPAPDKPYTEKLEVSSYQLQQLTQSGWVVDFPSYKNFEQVNLPRKIKFTNGEINGTLLVRNWELKAQ